MDKDTHLIAEAYRRIHEGPMATAAAQAMNAPGLDLEFLKKFVMDAIKGDEVDPNWEEEYGRLENQLAAMRTEQEVLQFASEHTNYAPREIRIAAYDAQFATPRSTPHPGDRRHHPDYQGHD